MKVYLWTLLRHNHAPGAHIFLQPYQNMILLVMYMDFHLLFFYVFQYARM